jgi:hypothetical protein
MKARRDNRRWGYGDPKPPGTPPRLCGPVKVFTAEERERLAAELRTQTTVKKWVSR